MSLNVFQAADVWQRIKDIGDGGMHNEELCDADGDKLVLFHGGNTSGITCSCWWVCNAGWRIPAISDGIEGCHVVVNG